jgi:hypothetical protein
MVCEGQRVTSRVVFGEPRPGFKSLADVIKSVPGRSYRNGDGAAFDVVTGVPFSFSFEPYVHPTRLIDVCARPAPNDPWGFAAWHHVQLYQQALKEKTSLPLSLAEAA